MTSSRTPIERIRKEMQKSEELGVDQEGSTASSQATTETIRELLCQKCGREHTVWFAQNPLWNAVAADDWSFLCMDCFTMLAEAKGIVPTAWAVLAEEELNRLRRDGLVFMSMEITPTEASEILADAWLICSLVSGVSDTNSNWAEAKPRAWKWLKAVSEMHFAEGRVLLKCASCGHSRSDTAVIPTDDPSYLRIPNPARQKPPAQPARPEDSQ